MPAAAQRKRPKPPTEGGSSNLSWANSLVSSILDDYLKITTIKEIVVPNCLAARDL